MLLMIDNYDSFTYNLVQYFAELGARVRELDLPTVIVQEGGYNLAALGPCVAEVLRPFC